MHPARSRRISLGFLFAGLVGLAIAWWMDGEAGTAYGVRLFFFSFAPVAVLGGGLGALVSQSRARLHRRLAGGEDLVARWRVDADTWQRFVQVDADLAAAGTVPNELTFPESVPATGVDIVVGRGAVAIGEAVHVVPERGSPEVLSARLDDSRLKVSFVELELLYSGGTESDVHTLLRFPVADGALRAARQTVAHFNRETPGTPDFFHGPGDGSDPEDLAKCWSCGYETHKLSSRCARCGATMQSRRWARRSGAVLAVLGGGLAGGMYLLLKILMPALRTAIRDDIPGPVRFSGTPGQAMAIVALLGLILAFGLATFGYGTFQLVTGRRSKLVVQGMLGLVAVVVLVGLLIAR